LYLCAGLLLIPFFLYRRLIKRKSSAPWRAKLGYLKPRPANTPRVWIHAVSVGEATAAEPLVKTLRAACPALDVVVSTTTTTGQETAVRRYGAEQVFHYPLDLSGAVRRTLDRVQPSVIVLMELEVWPNLTAEARARGISVIVVNGRITERSAPRYKKFWRLAGPAFLRVRQWLVQSDEYAARFAALGVEASRIEVAGNIKYDAVDTSPPDSARRESLRADFGLAASAQVLMGGSTHPSEEASLVQAYTRLRGTHPALRLVLAPRHPERIQSVEAGIAAAGFAVIRRGAMREKGAAACIDALDRAQRDSWVLLVDTVGELKQLYALADVAFIGGSLIPHGGQNVMEPCGMGVAVLHGPHMHNFKDAIAILRACRGAVEADRSSLQVEIEKVLDDPQRAREMAARARDAFVKAQGATARAADCIFSLLREKFPKEQ
jgi:3-deoxy-D-manno-octulosonic-acid transferase